jgi:hypothetical protein
MEFFFAGVMYVGMFSILKKIRISGQVINSSFCIEPWIQAAHSISGSH